VHPDPQRSDRLEVMADRGRRAITALMADHRPCVFHARPSGFRALVRCEDVGISHRPVASARHRSGDHPAVVAESGEHEEVVEQSELEEACVAVAAVPGERPGAQLVRAAHHVPGKSCGNDGRTRRTWIHRGCFASSRLRIVTRVGRDRRAAFHSPPAGRSTRRRIAGSWGPFTPWTPPACRPEPTPHGSHGYAPFLLSHTAVSARRRMVTALTSSSV
jgi:hypothetical protein